MIIIIDDGQPIIVHNPPKKKQLRPAVSMVQDEVRFVSTGITALLICIHFMTNAMVPLGDELNYH